MSQNIWEYKTTSLQRQKRRAQLISSLLKTSSPKSILDIGCAEGFTTSFFSNNAPQVIGIEIDISYLKIAKKNVKNADFINASLNYLPFKKDIFDAVCILEVLEHLDSNIQKTGLEEVDRILRKKGTLIVSVPYKENIIKTKCIHCGKITPLYGHLHSLDESYISKILPSARYGLMRRDRLPNVEFISSHAIFAPLPFAIWKWINRILGVIRKGYWIIITYTKE